MFDIVTFIGQFTLLCSMRLSLALNILLLASLLFLLHRLGGWRYALYRFRHDEAGLYEHRRQLFERLPAEPGAVVFLGDSQVQGCEWRELCGGLTAAPVLNRGIAADHVAGVQARLGEVLRHRPREILLQVGVNDLLFGKSAAEIAAGYRAIVERVRRESPGTRLVVHGVLPVNNGVKRVGIGNDAVRALNRELADVARQYELAYIDLHPALSDAEGNLASRFTSDGIHLNGDGYEQWRQALAAYWQGGGQ